MSERKIKRLTDGDYTLTLDGLLAILDDYRRYCVAVSAGRYLYLTIPLTRRNLEEGLTRGALTARDITRVAVTVCGSELVIAMEDVMASWEIGAQDIEAIHV